MRVINTSTADLSKLDTMGQLALYSGLDNLVLFEILSGLRDACDENKLATYAFEMELQAALLEMSFNGFVVDLGTRDTLISQHETELAKVHSHIHLLCEAIGYYEYYLTKAIITFSMSTGIAESSLPRSWDEWLARPVQWRRAVKAASPEALVTYHKALKEFGPPYLPGDRTEWKRKKNGAFNGNSPAQKLRLFYDFFGAPDNENADKEFVPPWSKTRGISEVRTRDVHGEFTPSADRESLEKIASIGKNFEPRDAAYWAMPFISCCLAIADYAKALGFLRCKLEKGYFKSSFGAVTETGRLASRENAQGFGSNAQNISPRLRCILTCEPSQKLAAIDYEQIESRIVGMICFRLFGATAYINATESGDLHSLAASLVWPDLGWPEEFTLDYLNKYGPPFPKEVVQAARKLCDTNDFYRGKTQRTVSKTLGHGTSYGGQPRTMAKMAHIDIALVTLYQQIFFEAFPELKLWHQWVAEQVQTVGEITSIFGRTRRFFGRPNDDSTLREAIAHEPQSTAADYTNRALLRLLHAVYRESFPIKLRAQKHDELIFTFAEADEDLIIPRAQQIMQEQLTIVSPDGAARPWSVPSDAMTGWNLGFFDKKNPEANPDGLMGYKPGSERRRQRNPFDFLKRRM